MQCPQCSYTRQARDAGPAGVCPRCHLIYDKFDPSVRARREELRVVAESRLHLERRLHSTWTGLLDRAWAWAGYYGWLGRLIAVIVMAGGVVAITVVIWSVIALILGVALMPSPRVVNVILGGR